MLAHLQSVDLESEQVLAQYLRAGADHLKAHADNGCDSCVEARPDRVDLRRDEQVPHL